MSETSRKDLYNMVLKSETSTSGFKKNRSKSFLKGLEAAGFKRGGHEVSDFMLISKRTLWHVLIIWHI